MRRALLLPLALLTLAACSTPGAPTPAAPEPPAQTVEGQAAEGQTAESTTGTPTAIASATDPAAACRAMVEGWPLEDQVGQLFMVGMYTEGAVDDVYQRMLTETRTGQVVLIGDNSRGVQSMRRMNDDLHNAGAKPDGVQLFVALDQEGGTIQRLKGPGFDRMPSAREQGRMTPDELRAAAARWGGQMSDAGIDVALAPVADVVPADGVASNEPVGQLGRHFGETPEAASAHVQAFVRGMQDAGLATSLKHFPGLGHVDGNTDFSGDVRDDVVDADDEGLVVFRAGMDAGADTVMVSNATYELIDPDHPATFSAKVIGLIRDKLDFDGVILSDDVGAAEQVAHIPPGDRALRFLEAGGDVVINGDPTLQKAMVTAVRERAASDERFAEEVTTKATRVVAMKARHGGADCG